MDWGKGLLVVDREGAVTLEKLRWESDFDVALRESLRSNTVQFETLLAKQGKLPKLALDKLRLRGLGVLLEGTVETATALFPYQGFVGAFRPKILSVPLRGVSGSGGYIQPMDRHHTIPSYMGAADDQFLVPFVRFQHRGLHEFLDNWALPDGQPPRFGAPRTFEGETRPWGRENGYLRSFARKSAANRKYIVEELRKFYKAHGYYYQIKDIFELEAAAFIQNVESRSLLNQATP